MKELLSCLLIFSTITYGMTKEGDDTHSEISVTTDCMQNIQSTFDGLDDIKLHQWEHKVFMASATREEISSLIKANHPTMPARFYPELAFMAFCKHPSLTLKQQRRLLMQIGKLAIKKEGMDTTTIFPIDYFLEKIGEITEINANPVQFYPLPREFYAGYALRNAEDNLRMLLTNGYALANPDSKTEYGIIIDFLRKHGAETNKAALIEFRQKNLNYEEYARCTGDYPLHHF